MIDLQKLLEKIKPYVLSWAHPDWKDWTPTLTGWSSNPTNTVYRYLKKGKTVMLVIRQAAVGTSDSTAVTFTLPFTAATITNMVWTGYGIGVDNNVVLTTPIRGDIPSAGTGVTLYKDFSAAAWTNSGNKRIATFTITYEAA